MTDPYFRDQVVAVLHRIGWSAKYDPHDPYDPIIVYPRRSDYVPAGEQERQYSFFTHSWTGPSEWVMQVVERTGRLPRGGPKDYVSTGIPADTRDIPRLVRGMLDLLLAALDRPASTAPAPAPAAEPEPEPQPAPPPPPPAEASPPSLEPPAPEPDPAPPPLQAPPAPPVVLPGVKAPKHRGKRRSGPDDESSLF